MLFFLLWIIACFWLICDPALLVVESWWFNLKWFYCTKVSQTHIHASIWSIIKPVANFVNTFEIMLLNPFINWMLYVVPICKVNSSYSFVNVKKPLWMETSLKTNMFLIFCFVLISHRMNVMKHITPAQMHNTSVHRMNGIPFKFNKIKKTSLKVFAHNSELFLWTFNISGSRYRRRGGHRGEQIKQKIPPFCFCGFPIFPFTNSKQQTYIV